METLAELIGQSSAVETLRAQARRIVEGRSADRRLPSVLIQGDTGTGKGLLARALHRAGPRANGPFVDVNCAAIPETLLESELFGYQRGAFTDAREPKAGLFQTAHRGTIFLDEVGLLPAALQAKLLSVLQERAVRRLGATRAEPVDVWVIAATNEDLVEALRERRFREDLYHRLAVVTLVLPPLRTRGADILDLAQHFLGRACADYGLPDKTLAADARAALLAHPWPGNVRELSNALERAALLTDSTALTAAHLALADGPAAVERPAEPPGPAARPRSSRDAMREHLERVLAETGWNISRTAAILGVSRNTVMARIARFRLRRPGRAEPEPTTAEAPARTPVPLAPPKGARWEPRRLTFLRLHLETPGNAAELEPVAARPLEIASEKLRGFGGRIEGLSPTSLLAVFGLEPRDEPAVLAGHSAMVIRNAARKLGAETGDAERLKIGLHTAELLVRVGAGAPVLDADAGRRAWNAVEAEMTPAPPGAIVATAPAAALLRRRFTLAPLGPATTAYRVDGLWHADPSAKGQRADFVGRREELALLESRLASAAEGRGQVVAIAGEAGLGKSRLLVELAASSRAESVRYLEGRCIQAEVQTPFYPLLQILRSACGITEAESRAAIAGKLAATLGESGLDAEELAPDLLPLLDATAMPPSAASSAAVKKRLFTAIQRLLVAQSARRPLLVVVEDLHWTDPSSDACLAAIVESMAGAAILLVTTYRPEYQPAWATLPQVLRLTLPPLAANESLALIRRVLDVGFRSEKLERDIEARAEGNPLFLEELSRSALERGDGSLPEQIPATVEEAIAARFVRLHPRVRAILTAAAVIGRDAPGRLLREVTELAGDALDDGLGRLQRSDFLYPTTMAAGETGYTFKHALVQQAAYAKLAGADRRALHVRALDALERLYPDRLSEHVEQLAHHAVLGEARERAVRYLLRAGQKASARSALAEGITHLRRGLDLLAGLPDSAARVQQELDFQVALGHALTATRGYAAAEVGETYARARTLCQLTGDPVQLFRVLVGLWTYYVVRADYATALALAERLAAQAEGQPAPAPRVHALYCLGFTRYYIGDFAGSREALERGTAIACDDRDPGLAMPTGDDVRIHVLAQLGLTGWHLGLLDRALTWSDEGIALARRLGHPYGVSFALVLACMAHVYRREVDPARALAAEGLAIARDKGYAFMAAVATFVLGWVAAETEDGAAGWAQMQGSLNALRSAGAMMAHTMFTTILADVAFRRGRLEVGKAALADAEAALAGGERYFEAEIHRVRGQAAADAGAVDEATLAGFREALAVAAGQGNHGHALRAATGLAALLAGSGRGAEARAVLAPAHAAFSEGLACPDLAAAAALLQRLP